MGQNTFWEGKTVKFFYNYQAVTSNKRLIILWV